MNCAEIDELAGALALSAVPDTEAAEVYEHLTTCPEQHRLIADLIEVVQFLPLAVEEVEPPSSLRSRLMAAALADDTALAGGATPARTAQTGTLAASPAGPSQDTATPATEPILLRPRTGRRWLTPAVLAAAALFLLALGLGAWNVGLQRRLDDRTAAKAMDDQVLAAVAAGAQITPLSRDGGVVGTLVRPQNGGPDYIIGQMPALASDKSYEAWFIRDGKPVPAGVFHSSGLAILTLQGDATGAQAVALTREPRKGSQTPTLPILAQAPLS